MLVRSSVRGCCLVGFWQCTRSSRISDFVYSDVSGRQWTEIRVHRTGLNFFLCNRYFDVGHQIIKFGSPVHVYVRGVGLCSFTWNWTLTRWDDRKVSDPIQYSSEIVMKQVDLLVLLTLAVIRLVPWLFVVVMYFFFVPYILEPLELVTFLFFKVAVFLLDSVFCLFKSLTLLRT